MQLRVDCAGWTIHKEYASRFPAEGSHLTRYAERFPAVEVDSCFTARTGLRLTPDGLPRRLLNLHSRSKYPKRPPTSAP